MGNLEKVGLVVLKSGYNIVPYGQLENAMYNLNNDSAKFKHNYFAIDGKHLQMKSYLLLSYKTLTMIAMTTTMMMMMMTKQTM